MKIKLVVSAVILASVTAVGGCADIKTAARQPVKEATSPMVQSMYAPGTDEGCTALGSE